MAFVSMLAGAHLATAATLIFNANGIFADGALMSGTITIDTTAGAATAVNINVTAPDALNLAFIQFQNVVTPTAYELQLGATSVGLPNLDLALPTSGSVNPLIGYTGGSLTTASDLRFSSTHVIVLSSGSFTLVPEPAPFALMGLGLSGVALFGLRRLKARS